VYLKKLNLTNFRSYTNLELELSQGVSVFIGENGEGKTNIVEPILYLSTLASHRTNTDLPLIKLGSESAYIRSLIHNNNRDQLIELEINANKANRARVNQQPVKSQREILGSVQSTIFSPEDLDLVRGDPGERRKFLDQLLVQNTPRLAGVLSDYERSLKQRNSLLKSRAPQSALEPWNNHLIEFASELIAQRLLLLENLTPHIKKAYENISLKKEVSLRYKSTIENPTLDREENKELLRNKLKEVERQEFERGITLIGPHRDDLLLYLGPSPVKGYASHGESWSVALSLKLASYLLLKSEGADPILILDDVFSELDQGRRENLVELAMSAEQALITIAVADDLPKNLDFKKFNIKNGAVL